MVSTVAKVGWFQTALIIRGSVLSVILPRIGFFAGLGLLTAWLHVLDPAIPFRILGDLTNNVACNLVLGLLLVFRTNTAYERFWEGRKAWGMIVVGIRNLAREIQVGNVDTDQTAIAEKQAALNGLIAFAIATKLHLRQQPITNELDAYLTPTILTTVTQSKNPPLALLQMLGYYLQELRRQQQIDSSQRFVLTEVLNTLVEGLTSCERIASTPMPIAYSIYLKRLILIYCGLLPFSLVDQLHWWTGAVVAIISFVLLGVEEIGNEIEDPFGTDPNDLPIDTICNTVVDSVNSAMNFTPISFAPALDTDASNLSIEKL